MVASKIDSALQKLAQQAEQDCQAVFARLEEICAYNEMKTLQAFQECGVAETHLHGSTGYGYDDRGRDLLDEVYAKIMGTEDALVRHHFVSGTHALTVALFGILRPGDVLLSLTGAPYDTMEEVIGLHGSGNGSLRDFGVEYRQVDLTAEGTVDLDGISQKAADCKVAYIQRSRGYSLRDSLSVEQIGQIIQKVREVNPNAIVMVDNCYGEFVEKKEPTQVGADLIIGSLIKNPGGGIAETGGYIAGRKDLIELCAYRLTCVGMGKEVGCSLHQNRSMFMGLFLAPSVVCSALKTAAFASRLFELMGYTVTPAYDAPRTDIITAICLGNAERLIAFCHGLQKGSPIDSNVQPIPWDMPGYDSQVIMAAGAFTLGASIELSADAPLREPYAVWLQGGLTYHSGKFGVLSAAQEVYTLTHKEQ